MVFRVQAADPHIQSRTLSRLALAFALIQTTTCWLFAMAVHFPKTISVPQNMYPISKAAAFTSYFIGVPFLMPFTVGQI